MRQQKLGRRLVGLTLIIESGVEAVAGGTSVSYKMSQGRTLHAGGLILTTVQLIVIAVSVVVMAGVHGLLRYTKLGKAMRATAANRTLARNCGIRTRRVITVTWALTGALCGLAGVVFAIDAGSFNPTSTSAGWRPAAARCSSWNSGLGPCWPSPT